MWKKASPGHAGATLERGFETIPERSPVAMRRAGSIDVRSDRACSKSRWRQLPARRAAVAVVLTVLALSALTAWRIRPSRTDPDRLWAEAERAFLSGHWQRASALLKQLERLRPKTSLDWTLEAQLAITRGQFLQAFAALARVPDSHSIAPQAHLLAGRLHRQLRCLRKAEAEFRQALALKPNLIEAHKELIYILGLQSRRREVDAEFHQLARLTRLNHHDLMTWGLTHFTHWNPDIVQDLDGCIKADPMDRYSRLAVVELLLERPEVESYIQRILEPLPDTDPDALAIRINLAFNLGRFAEAESMLAKAPSNHPRISRMRGEMALRRHDLDAAIGYFREALSAEPYDRVSPMQLALALQLKGDKAEADVYLNRVKRLNRIYNTINHMRSPKREDHFTDLAELGKVFEEAGLDEEAKAWYSLAIATDPLDGEAQEGLYRTGRATAKSSSN
jgi:tetratricopeptide (TPR) repeat protein